MDDFEKEVSAVVAEAIKGMGAGDVQFSVERSSVETVDLAVPCFPLAKALRKAPKAIAEELAAAISPSGMISSVSAANGFLNFNIDPAALVKGTLDEICEKGSDYGTLPKSGIRVNVEHTSTNPTGPIHVGRARNPLIGDTLARCLKKCGHDVATEYYVNDVGKQVVVLTWGVNNATPEEVAAEIEEHARTIGQNEKERDKTD
ncbi:MAG: arginine--tRNA ligase, partial [Candidatus Methanomethylophilaceae archaeon]|nr:arginine--tRNA ligase [Candidatus Methanomethylophilaceae archaeon]